jgi:arsenate reductase
MNIQKVLFVCIHNSARSQMAEAFLKHYGGDKFNAESAGLEPGKLNPIVVEVMQEEGIDISNNKTKDVFEFFKQGKMFSHVITVCDEASAERCPIFPGVCERLHWSFEDPASIEGTYEQKLAGTRIIRDQIKIKIKDWIKEVEIKFIVGDGEK